MTIATGAPITRVRHAYTHFKITLEAVACRWESGRVRLDGPVAFRWVPLRELPNGKSWRGLFEQRGENDQ